MTEFRQTIREQIIAALTAALSNIRTANGYNLNVGQNVKRGQRIEEGERLPAVGIYAFSETNVPIQGKNTLTMDIRVEAVSKFSSKNPSVVAEAMLGDLIRCITSDPASIIKLVDGIQYSEGGIEDYPGSTEHSVGAYAVFKVTYKTVKGDPFIHERSLSIEQSESIDIVEDVQT